jgi:hypothetical protein
MLMLLVLMVAVLPVQAEDPLPAPTLQVAWGEGAHAYRLVMGDDGNYTVDVDLDHLRNGTALSSNVTFAWSLEDGRSVATLTVDQEVAWNDTVHLTVDVMGVDGSPLDWPQVERTVQVGRWNQPLADHEITTSSNWTLDQTTVTDGAPQRFLLEFEGNGWQERVGEQLEAWELGDGRLVLLETADNSTIDLDLVLDRVWRNESSTAGVLQASVFDAQGFGTLTLIDDIDGARTEVAASVTEATLNRSIIEGIVSERLRIEANGTLDVHTVEDNESEGSLDIDGTVAVLVLELWDEDGVRRLDHQQIEAVADFTLIEDGTRMDLDLEAFQSLQRWEDGVRVNQLDRIRGSGTFGFVEQDENTSVAINGTVHDFHQWSEDGETVADRLHVDGVLTGDAEGTFGIVRDIDATLDAENASGVSHRVHIIHQEEWFNFTGLNGGSFFGNQGIGAHHNESWSYDVVGIDHDNRTIRVIWQQSGPDASEGDEKPERSPIPREPEAPEPVDGLGDVTVGRETGLMPIPAAPGDRFLLDEQAGMGLLVEVLAYATDESDGRTFETAQWAGTYAEFGGTAEGHLVAVGPLKGLSTSVIRSLEVPYGDDGEVAWLNESQTLARVLSPSVVTAEGNTPPVFLGLSQPNGLAAAEGARSSLLVAEVVDVDWNLERVEVDLSALGLGVRVLNDRGQDGDVAVDDDRWTTTLSVLDTTVGEFSAPVTVVDAFTSTTYDNATVQIVNPAPRLLSIDLVPDRVQRGGAVIVEANVVDQHGVASVAVDLSGLSGGAFVPLVQIAGTTSWSGAFTLPSGVQPGVLTLPWVLEDDQGASAVVTRTVEVGLNGGLVGPFLEPEDPDAGWSWLIVLNDAPTITAESLVVDESRRGDSCVAFSVQVSDQDGLNGVQLDRGTLTPLGEQSGWTSMRNDGQGPDEAAGDDVWSACLEVRTGTPLGAHELLVRASDTYGEVAPTVSTVMRLDAGGSTNGGGQNGELHPALVWGGLVLVAALVVGLLVGLSRREGGGGDRFGDL